MFTQLVTASSAATAQDDGSMRETPSSRSLLSSAYLGETSIKLTSPVTFIKTHSLVNIKKRVTSESQTRKDERNSMMVEKGCESCREWQEHYYCEHMDENESKIRFFKLMTGDFAKGISLPEKLTRKFNGQITEAFDLNTPSGETWHIGLNKNGNELFLVSGWEDFVKAHELQENDLVIFTRTGNSSFEVLIFEANGCEKVSSLFGNSTGPNINKYYDSVPPQGERPESPNGSNYHVKQGRFAADHLERRSHEIMLRRPNKKEKWLVRYYYSQYTRCFKNLVFFKFVRENKLREGDIRMVGRGCESCRKWQEHNNWEHMDVSKIRFFKFMTGDFAKGISIPEKFVENFNGNISKEFNLKAPSGETWHIGVDKDANKLFLKSGWKDFVKAYELQENDLLIFTCRDDSSFEVLIFDASGCEKVSLFANKTGPHMLKNCADKANRGKHDEHYSLSDSEDTTTPFQLVGSPQDATTSQNCSGKKSRELSESPNSINDHVKCEENGEEDSDEECSNQNYYYSRIADRLSDEEKEEVITLASIRSDNPAFFTILQKSHVRRSHNFLIFPSRFVADHLDSNLHEITLCRPNRKEKWCVKYYHEQTAQGIRNYNFSRFVCENKLREGDICAFELMKGVRRVAMTVHVIRNVDDSR
ncbi:hypothetical protein EJB05_00636, partial [Eragrostis curvula]